MNKRYLLSLLLSGFSLQLCAQQNTVAGGGEAKGNGGTVNFSIGQIDYINLSGNTALLTQGVEQPYEIMVYPGNKPIVIDRSSEFTLYPNPTRDFTTLHVKYSVVKSMSYILYDILGRVIAKQRLINVRTTIRLDDLPSAVYILTVIDDSTNKVITQFKIVKII